MLINSGPWRAIETHNTHRFVLKNSTVINNTNFFGADSMLFLDHDNFYGAYDAEEMLGSWNGSNISITNCTAQDYNPSDPSHNGFAAGRFFVGSTPGDSQRFIYLGNNATVNLAPSIYKSDQNAGEQILWDQNAGNLSPSTFLAATGATIQLQELVSATNYNLNQDIVIAGGAGIGQRRSVAAFDSAAGIITLDKPWAVLPDASSTILRGRVVANVAIYNNTLNGKPDYSQRNTASSGINLFNDGFDFVGDSNTISDVNTGISLSGLVQGTSVLPIINSLWINNTVNNAIIGSALTGGVSLATPAILDAVFRYDTFSNLTSGTASGANAAAGILANSGNLNVFEDDTFLNLPTGVNVNNGGMTGNLILSNDSFAAMGSGAIPNSTGFVTASTDSANLDPAVVGTTFTGFSRTSANTSSPYYLFGFTGAQAANNNKLYLVSGAALSGTNLIPVVSVFDPSQPLNEPSPFINAVLGGTNANLQGARDLLFSNTAYAGANANPVACNMYVLNGGAGGNGTLSEYTFDATGSMTYNGDVITAAAGLGAVLGMAGDAAGNIYILSGGSAPHVWKWDGAHVTNFVDTSLFKSGASATIRTPGGMAFDAAGNLYISYSGFAAMRRFAIKNGAVASYTDITSIGGGPMKLGPDNNLYICSGAAIYAFNPSTSAVSLFTNSTALPAIAGQTSITALVFGPRSAADTDTGDTSDLYLCTSGNYFLAAHGPGALNSGAADMGTEVFLRNDVYPVAELPTRNINLSSDASANGGFQILNAGFAAFNYTLSTVPAWLSITSGSSGLLNGLSGATPTFAVNPAGLLNGTYYGDITFTYSNSAGTETGQNVIGVTFVQAADPSRGCERPVQSRVAALRPSGLGPFPGRASPQELPAALSRASYFPSSVRNGEAGSPSLL